MKDDRKGIEWQYIFLIVGLLLLSSTISAIKPVSGVHETKESENNEKAFVLVDLVHDRPQHLSFNILVQNTATEAVLASSTANFIRESVPERPNRELIRRNLADFDRMHWPTAYGTTTWVLEIHHVHILTAQEKAGNLTASDVNYVEWFNITVGDRMYYSLLHPILGGNRTFTLAITGHHYVDTGDSTDSMTLASWPEYDPPSMTVYGAAGVIGVMKFNHNSDLHTLGAKNFKKAIEVTEHYHIWYLWDESTDSPWIDDSHMEQTLQKVEDYSSGRLGHKALVYLDSHGTGPYFLYEPFIWSGLTYFDYYGFIYRNTVTKTEIHDKLTRIQNDGHGDYVKTFYWAHHCRGNDFDYDDSSDWNNYDSLIVWYYHPSAFCTEHRYYRPCPIYYEYGCPYGYHTYTNALRDNGNGNYFADRGDGCFIYRYQWTRIQSIFSYYDGYYGTAQDDWETHHAHTGSHVYQHDYTNGYWFYIT
ncbi:MAG: hypothetical protein ACFFGZ_01095 [Candidatus Thorarchaeota archaeon]